MRSIRAAVSPGETRLAVCDDQGELLEYGVWRPYCPDGVGDVYAGQVHKIVPALGGIFVALDDGDFFGFLPLGAAGKHLSEGDLAGVRVIRAAQGGKGPRLVLCPEEALPAGKKGLIRRGPGILHELAARNEGAPILIDDARAMAGLRGEFGDRVSLVKSAFDEELAAQVAGLYEPVCVLAGGGRVHFSITPALSAIDVDLGAGSGADIGKNRAHLDANRAAIAVIARQICLRNLGGVVLIDFAGLKPRARAALGPDLQAALLDDPQRPRLLGFTHSGLAEILRPRARPPLAELAESAVGLGLAALREAATIVRHQPQARLHLRLRGDVAAALRSMPGVVEALTYGASFKPVIVDVPGMNAAYEVSESVS